MDSFAPLFSALTKNGQMQQFPASFLRLESLMFSSLPQTLYPAVPADLPQLQSQGRRLLEQVRTLVLSPAIRTKTVIGLGGCFSSGKSSLVNAILSRRLLPTEIVPTTACPTYVVKDTEERVILCNRFFTRSSLSLGVLPQLTHGYYATGEEEEQPQDLSHLVRDLCVCVPNFPYSNLALLDTPGFTGEMDTGPVRNWLNSSNALIWVINAEAGSLTKEELTFLRQLNPQMEKFFVLNKCDKKTNADIARIKRQITLTLDQNGIPYAGLAAYSCRKREDFDGAAIEDFLHKWDREKPLPALPEEFFSLFWKYLEGCLQAQRTVGRRLNRFSLLATSLTDAPTLQDLIQELGSDRQALREEQTRLETLQALFFASLEELGREIDCPLAAPSGQTPAALRCDPLRLFQEQKQALEIPNGDAKYRILLAFTGMSPCLSQITGGVEKPSHTALRLQQALTFPCPSFVHHIGGTGAAVRISEALWD